MRNEIHRHPGGAAGYLLVEVAVALALAAVSLSVVAGLLPAGVTMARDSVARTTATGIARAVMEDLRGPLVNGKTRRFGFVVPVPGGAGDGDNPQAVFFTIHGGVSSGSVDEAATDDAYFRANVGLTPPAAGRTAATGVRLQVVWPAELEPDVNQWPSRRREAVEVISAMPSD